MKSITSALDIAPKYPIEGLLPEGLTKEDVLFIDIETTGLSAKNSCLYMVGCVYYKDDVWNTIQWMAENYDEELTLLTAFFEFIHDFT